MAAEEQVYWNVVSNIPGRIRVKISQLHNNSALAKHLAQLDSVMGIEEITVNIYSKSVLILYNPQFTTRPEILCRLEEYLQSYAICTKEKLASMQFPASALEPALPLSKPESSEFTTRNTPWHRLSVQELIELLQTDEKYGLSSEQVDALLEQVGLNEFAEKKKPSILIRFVSQFDGFLVKLLLGASIISMFLGSIGDALTILTIVTVEAVLGVWQNLKAEKSLEVLKEYTSAHARVIRDGNTLQIPAKELVPGDIISFAAGDLIPADARLLESANLEINEASLTGESLPVEKSHKIKHTGLVPLADRKNMVYMGTTVARGTGKALVVQTGMQTELGLIANMLTKSEPSLTPLQQDLNKLAREISWGCLGICGAIMVSGILGGHPFFEMLRTGVSLAIGAIPEGLTSILTISLAFGVQRMAKKGAIIKELPVTEILSCADVICTDKTGTLTTGEMTVTQLYTLQRSYQVSGSGYFTTGKFSRNHLYINPRDEYNLEKLITIGVLCNNATYSRRADQSLEIIGDPTEGALWVLAHKANIHVEDFECFTREKEVAFDSETKKMLVVCKGPDQAYTVNIKGDPNLLLTYCSKILDNGTIRTLQQADQQKVNEAIERLAGNALRVIGFAYKDITDPADTDLEQDLIFVGLAGMMDPPRPEVREAICKCHKAGIRLVMITGDHKKTAEEIGRQIHLLDNGGITVTGDELDNLSAEELGNTIDQISIFARTSPHQKLRIVKALKEKGHIVVMAGDGVNDAPAIKEANIGIAMGKNGTAVTLDSSAIILTDDNFSTIVNAIEEGRGISGNIKKFMRFVLSGNLGEVLAIFTASLLGLPAPLIPGQILMVNLITEGIPALAIGVDTPEKDNMLQRPRDAQKTIFDHQLVVKTFSRGLLMGASTFGLYVTTLLSTGNLLKARTMAYANLVANQMFHVFDCRKGSLTENQYIVPSIIIASGLLLTTIYISPLNGLFATCPLGPWEWLYILFTSGFIGRLDFIKEKANHLLHHRTTPEILPT